MSPGGTGNNCRVGISIGDFNGIGLEVIIKTLADNRMLQFCTPVIFGSTRILSYYKKVLDLDQFNYSSVKNIDQLNPKINNVVNLWNDEVDISIGEASQASGEHARISLDESVKHLKEGKIDVLVTAPLSKSNMQTDDAVFTGHTEYLEEQFDGQKSLMLMCHENIRVGLVCNHVPLKEVPEAIDTSAILKKLHILNNSLIRDFGISKPRIAVLGLNPHAGDNGLIGDEEAKFIAPAIRQAKNEKILAIGPFPADGFFSKGYASKFDAVLAMYHDQGLIPFKILANGEGVNFTAGLPVVRTSPDHGTAFDIAGKNEASPDSFRAAIFQAINIWKNRNEHEALTANPLRKPN